MSTSSELWTSGFTCYKKLLTKENWSGEEKRNTTTIYLKAWPVENQYITNFYFKFETII